MPNPSKKKIYTWKPGNVSVSLVVINFCLTVPETWQRIRDWPLWRWQKWWGIKKFQGNNYRIIYLGNWNTDHDGNKPWTFVSKGICQHFDWKEHRNLDVMMASSVNKIYLKWKWGNMDSRNSYAINKMYLLELKIFNV